MGYFLAVSAFRDVTVNALGSAVVDFATQYSVPADLAVPRNVDVAPRVDATVFKPVNGWTIILWPEYFNIHDLSACKSLSNNLACLASTVHVYDSDYWTHALYEKGSLLDRFCSFPGYFGEDPVKELKLKEEWIGHPEVIAEKLGVSVESIRGYFVDVGQFRMPLPPRPTGLLGLFRKQPKLPLREPNKAYPDSEYDLGDFWVFTELWHKLGIEYPDEMGQWVLRIRFDLDSGEAFPLNDGQR